ncbi:MAG: FAD-dependent monooxygenase [Alphaproteobacteria bacterium]|jgi:2-polyprenyl-6-methoxyphenol hydroxylase-like FAD-dependent oxidoreductase|nr:FAD-dependent monooxygenase [Alphaproteobacteria bacterium]MBT4084273.1 FAD-dependent monooxygenase [Alphaproteobacteria bacterium]MBT4545788.1 FAD-dependent monooxygenase [Alphaproteobacteria bacterium]MBT5917423.1 FAD-dependent monooxygenase [Alphaproteobacteria bacterium]
MEWERRVIVVGAGPVGLVAAMLLAQAKIPVTVIEAEDSISDDLRASTFHPPTLDMLDPFGVTEQLLHQGLTCPTWQIRMFETAERAVFDMSVLSDDTAHPYRLQCEQARLCQIIHDKLAKDSNVDFRFGQRVTGLAQDDDGVTLHVQSADGDGKDEIRGQYVIAADGASSIIRELLQLEFDGKTYPETTVLASTSFPFHEHLEDLSNVNYCWSPTGNFSLLRLKGFWRCSLYYNPELSMEEAASDERVQGQLRQIMPGFSNFEILDRRPYRVHQRIIKKYNHGRVLMAGDSAHLNSPSGGMGMNGGIHDAFNLVEKLTAVCNGGDQDLLDLYTRQRQPVAYNQILVQADKNRKRMAEKDPARRAELLKDLQAITADRDRMHDYLYRSSMFSGLDEAKTIA